ncbi:MULTISPECIES: efflux RND transporter periplasmic adaptor subunit [Acidobacteriaceae]|uniref:efflux RND transporter periplasmic adaptor subunit n=1 Tax=Acidobacteriaceae TaxID=204434 RepID=UPI00131D1525|nr:MULTISPECIES: efflux RND transporter periplasmic adaptor subunit [Acidobacteriaceae]MDW5265980.1 efflux RND transporter periplasmic adaptor subunit [Edaphobacter sp.]
MGTISEQIMSDAVLSPLAQAAISPKITAPVRAFYVQRGSKVKAGQLLAVLENHDLAAQALDSKGQYSAAQAAFDMQTKAQAQEDYRKAELDVAQAKAQLELQRQIVSARQKLFAEGAIAGRDYDTAAAALVQTQATYDIARNHLDSLKAVSRAAMLQQAQGQLASAKGKYLASEAQVGYSEVRSPITGVVTDRPLFPGETANSGSPLITVMDTSFLLAKVHLSQTLAQRLKVGDEASVMVPGVDDPVPAKISLISPALDPGSTTVEVWIRVDNSTGRYKAGTSARASIKGRTAVNAIKVPLSAVLTAQDDSKSVMVMGADGVAHRRVVQLGISDGDDVQIAQGLNGSETVITTGAYGLDDGTKVKIGKAGDDDKAEGETK